MTHYLAEERLSYHMSHPGTSTTQLVEQVVVHRVASGKNFLIPQLPQSNISCSYRREPISIYWQGVSNLGALI
jgi:hypothetical protein